MTMDSTKKKRTGRISLHILHEELLPYVKTWITSYAGAVAAVWIAPTFSALSPSSSADFSAEVAVRGTPFRIVFSCVKLNTDATSLYEFMRQNEDIECLVDVGPKSPEGLRESVVFVNAGSVGWAYWQKALRTLRKETKTGLWAINPHTGASVECRENRYTPGAATLLSSGGQLLAAGGMESF